MTGEITSGRAGAILAGGLRGQWTALFAFLGQPRLPDAYAGASASALVAARLFVLDLLAISAFATLVLAAGLLGFEPPENLNSQLDMNAATIVLLVLVAPVLEEIVFRGWLSGRPGALAALLATLAGAAGLAAFGPDSLVGPLALSVGLTLAVAAAVFLRGRASLPVFEKKFPVFFWTSAIAFALVHLANYAEGALFILLPLLVPQFVLGVLAGYVRVHCGLAWSIALHAAHNSFAVGIALLLGPGG